ncbi:MAG TPA: cyclic nucleotide-binding domain-containing protein, partial [Gaiellales bacterium]
MQGPDVQHRVDTAAADPTLQEPAAVAAFLAAYPPFDALSEDDLRAVSARVEIGRYAPGENILVEDGAPARNLYVVVSGAVELLHQGERVDLLDPGECFGHPSLLSQMAPAFTVRGHALGAVCYLIGGAEALDILGRPSGAGYIARSLRERLTRTGHVVHALPEMATVRVEDMITRPPVFCRSTDSIRAAAQVMTENRRSAILVSGGLRPLILTDAALRTRVISGDVSPDEPVSRIATTVVSVTPSQLAAEA